MKILGPIFIRPFDTRLLKVGEVWTVSHRELFRGMVATACIGDLLWIQEAFAEIRSNKKSPVGVHEMVPGMVRGQGKMPLEWQRLFSQGFLTVTYNSASAMVRSDSRRSVQIEALAADHIVGRVIGGNAATILAARGSQP